MKRYFYTLVLLTLLPFSIRSEEMRIGYPEFKPYTYTENGEAKGLGIDVFRNIANNLGLEFQLLPVETHGNAFARLTRDKLDAVLLATKNTQRDQTSIFSKPIANNYWSWFFIADKNANYAAQIKNKNIKVATITNTNTHNWLLQNDYKRISATIDITAMLRQIDRGRINAIFISERVLQHRLKMLDLNQDAFHVHRQTTKPFGIYVAKSYLSSKPNFMTKLNEEIVKLSPTEVNF